MSIIYDIIGPYSHENFQNVIEQVVFQPCKLNKIIMHNMVYIHIYCKQRYFFDGTSFACYVNEESFFFILDYIYIMFVSHIINSSGTKNCLNNENVRPFNQLYIISYEDVVVVFFVLLC